MAERLDRRDEWSGGAIPGTAATARDLHRQGVAAFRGGEGPRAADLFAQAIRLQPQEGDYYADLGLVLYRLGQRDAAEEGFRAAIHLKPNSPSPYSNLGSLLRETGRLEEAAKVLRQSLVLKPGFVSALNNLGCVLRDLRQPVEALVPLKKARDLESASPEIHNNLGNVYRDMGENQAAADAYAEAVRLRPGYLEAHNNLGSALGDLGRLPDALASHLNALKLNPANAEVHNNIGVVLHRLGRPVEAIKSYQTALQLDPQCPDAQANLGMALLLSGDYAEGWRAHEGRWRSRHMLVARRNFDAPQWDGGAQAKTILIHAEQGFGDTLQFCRFAPLIGPRHSVILEVQPPLIALMRRLPGVDQVIAKGDARPPIDAHCPMMSLPMIFGTTLQTVPGSTYLHADPAKAAAWAARLTAVPGLKVGLVWAGGARPHQPQLESTNQRRSITLQALAPLADVAGVSFVSLQKGPPADEARDPPAGMHFWDFTSELADFDDTAALIQNLDLVISVDTAVAHLGGGLGKPVWLLNRYDTCWRWLLDRDDSPWYPTLRQFRQPEPDDWATPISALRAALGREV